MVQKYQNEIPPIFYYGISTKTNEKDLKIPNLQALTLGRIIKMTLYKGFWISVRWYPLGSSTWTWTMQYSNELQTLTILSIETQQ